MPGEMRSGGSWACPLQTTLPGMPRGGAASPSVPHLRMCSGPRWRRSSWKWVVAVDARACAVRGLWAAAVAGNGLCGGGVVNRTRGSRLGG